MDGGNNFDQPVNLTGNYGYGTFDIKASGNFVYLTWSSYQHKSEKTDILFRKSSDNGTNFDQTLNLSTNVNESSSLPMLVTTGNNVYVGWGTTFPGDDLSIQTSNNGGNSFVETIDPNMLQEATSPEFPYTIVILLISITLTIAFYRIKFRN
ncbi:MAG: hypothetical protein ACREA5_02565 [Nitrosotalea sp.]